MITFWHFHELSEKHPLLHGGLRELYAESWQLKGSNVGTKRAFDEELKEVTKLGANVKITDPILMQQLVKEFNWHSYRMSQLHHQVIKSEVDKI